MVMLLLTQIRMLPAFVATRMHCWLIQLAVHQDSEGSSLRYSFLASWFSLGRDAWVYSSSDAGLCISPCWTSWDPSWLDSSVCWSLSEWQHMHLVYQSLLTVLYHLLTCWRCTLSWSTGSWWKCYTVLAPGSKLATCHQLNSVLLITFWVWFIQFLIHLTVRSPNLWWLLWWMLCQFVYEDVKGQHVQSLIKAEVNTSTALPSPTKLDT